MHDAEGKKELSRHVKMRHTTYSENTRKLRTSERLPLSTHKLLQRCYVESDIVEEMDGRVSAAWYVVINVP